MRWNLTAKLLERATPEAKVARFVKSAPQAGPKLFARSEFYDASAASAMSSTGDFLSRIWANFGAPHSTQADGFTYSFHDTTRDTTFTAFSTGSGPSYGGSTSDEVRPSIIAFEQLLAKTRPADCKIEYKTESGVFRSGAADSLPFDLAPSAKVAQVGTSVEIDAIVRLDAAIASGDFDGAHRLALDLRANSRHHSTSLKNHLKVAFDKIDTWRAMRR